MLFSKACGAVEPDEIGTRSSTPNVVMSLKTPPR